MKTTAADDKESGDNSPSDNANIRKNSDMGQNGIEETQDKVPWKQWIKHPTKMRRPPPIPTERQTSLEDSSGFFSNLVFHWMGDLIATGYNRPLGIMDFPHLSKSRLTEVNNEKIKLQFQHRLERGDKYPLLFALNHVFAWEFWMAGVYMVAAVSGMTLTPLLLKNMIIYATDAYYGDSGPVGKGIGMALGLSSIQVTFCIAINQFNFGGLVVGGMTRASLISMIYEKSQVISSRAKSGGRLDDDLDQSILDDKKFGEKTEQNNKKRPSNSNANGNTPGWSDGKVISLMSMDTARIDAAAAWFHLIWITPLQIAVTVIILIINIGVSALAGLALLFMMTPLLTWSIRVLARRRGNTNKITDTRISLTQEILQGVRFVKFFAWEKSFLEQLNVLRKKEIREIRVLLGIRSALNAVAMALPVFSAILAFVTFALTHEDLNAANIFSSLALFNGLRMPFNMFPTALAQTIDAHVSMGRIQEYLLAEEEEEQRQIDKSQKDALTLVDARFTWESSVKLDEAGGKTHDIGLSMSGEGKTNETNVPFHIKELNLAISRHELLAVVGTVGSGKTSLLAALAGDMRLTSGTVTQGGTMAYCPQYAWIQNATVRENILFGRPYDKPWYDRVVEACALRMDLDMLPHGDHTEIGERGITLSGGQRQRLNIARAIYFNAEIVLLDDPLSAVDAQVGRHIFQNAISGLLRDKCRVLATHQLHVLSQCDRIIWMQNGTIQAIGTFDELMSKNKDFVQLLVLTSKSKKVADEEVDNHQINEAGNVEESDNKRGSLEVTTKAVSTKAPEAPGLMQAEEKAQDSVSWTVYYAYVRACGSVLVGPLILFSVSLAAASNIIGTVWLGWWSSRKYPLATSTYIGVYVGLGVLQGLLTFVFAMVLTLGGTEASKKMLARAMQRVLGAPMSFFDTTPLGRIVNRFSKDVDVLDNFLTDAIRMYLFTLATVLSIFILILVYFPYYIAAIVPLSVLVYILGAYYRASAREIKRNESILRSIVFSRFGEALHGTATIRAYNVQAQFRHVLNKAIDEMDSCYFLTFSNQTWLSIRLDLIGITLCLITTILIVTSRFDLNPSIAAVILSYVIQFVGMLQMTVKQLSLVENGMNSTERIHYYGSELPQESDRAAPVEITPEASWPANGEIEFRNAQMRYRDGLPLVLKGLDLHIKGGERVGIVGRTGAGKSSIMSSLFRLCELSAGSIEIDGIDIAKVDFHQLRTKLAIIPQDPTLFRGTVRSNLDPFNQHSDLDLWRALQHSYLVKVGNESTSSTTAEDSVTDVVNQSPQEPISNKNIAQKITLETQVLEEGLNFSLGQRQLMALARALVRDSRIIVCDEATSSIDEETDRNIQRTMAEAFSGRTVLCIAHRLLTIVRYDRIVVMDDGCIVECAPPLDLWAREGGLFRRLCDKSGIRREDFGTV